MARPESPAAIPDDGWFQRWRRVLPLFLAEFVLWLGFGGLLPIMPLYFRQNGIDLVMLGVVIAAWPAARLLAEPAFGWIADRIQRKPLMAGALFASAALLPLPLLFVGLVPFTILRAAAGLATAAYDPAARGYLVDSVPRERHGEAFGLYGAAQMGGLMIGPAVGGLGTAFFGSEAFVFWLGAIGSAIAGLVILRMLPEGRRSPDDGSLDEGGPDDGSPDLATPAHRSVQSSFPPEGVAEMATPIPLALERSGAHPASMANRLLVAAIVINLGASFASGTYEVVWSLYLSSLGAGLDLIGASFAIFGIPMLILAPIAGRMVDRRGSLAFVIVGSLAAIAAGILYTFLREPVLSLPIILLESTGSAFLFPALFAVVGAGSPLRRSSTAQGLYGAAGTVGFIISSVVAGQLAAIDLRYPFLMFAAVMSISLVVGLLVGWRAIRALGRRLAPTAAP